jgi:hypothetical protein
MLSQLFAAAQGLATGPGLEVPRKSEMGVLVIDCVVIRWRNLVILSTFSAKPVPLSINKSDSF